MCSFTHVLGTGGQSLLCTVVQAVKMILQGETTQTDLSNQWEKLQLLNTLTLKHCPDFENSHSWLELPYTVV